MDSRDQESFSFVVASSDFFLFFFSLGTSRGWSGWSGGRAGSQERRLPPLECLGLEVRKSETMRRDGMHQRPETEDLRPETMNQRAESRHLRPEIRDDEPGARDPRMPETRECRAKTSMQRQQTRDLEQRPEIGDRRSETRKARSKMLGVVVFACCCLFLLFFVSWALHEGGVAGVVEGLA